MIINKTVIDASKILGSVNHLIDISGKSETTKEIFIVASDTEWLRLYWNPIAKTWAVTFFPGGYRHQVDAKEVKDVMSNLSQKYSKIRGFQYRSSPINLDIYQAR